MHHPGDIRFSGDERNPELFGEGVAQRHLLVRFGALTMVQVRSDDVEPGAMSEMQQTGAIGSAAVANQNRSRLGIDSEPSHRFNKAFEHPQRVPEPTERIEVSKALFRS